jgi:hypothetical protein
MFDFNFKFATPGSSLDTPILPEARRAPNRKFVRGDDPGDQQPPRSAEKQITDRDGRVARESDHAARVVRARILRSRIAFGGARL